MKVTSFSETRIWLFILLLLVLFTIGGCVVPQYLNYFEMDKDDSFYQLNDECYLSVSLRSENCYNVSYQTPVEDNRFYYDMTFILEKDYYDKVNNGSELVENIVLKMGSENAVPLATYKKVSGSYFNAKRLYLDNMIDVYYGFRSLDIPRDVKQLTVEFDFLYKGKKTHHRVDLNRVREKNLVIVFGD